MLEIEEARKRLLNEIKPIRDTEMVPLMDGVGRILAEDIYAPQDQPPFPRSPLDGYAVRGEDTAGASREAPVTLRVVGKIYAGSVFSGTVKQGETVRIMTGAPIPQGADAVIRQEDSDFGEEYAALYTSVAPYENYCRQGEDYKKGELLLKQGTRISGAVLALAASIGRSSLSVYRRPRIALFSSGDELMMPGEELAPGKIYDTNMPMIAGRMLEFGIAAETIESCPDDAAVMAEKIKKAAPHTDLIITAGGVSVGQKDIMHEVLQLLQVEQLFWRVRMRPGTPVLAAVYQGTPIICLSGNPFAATANFELLVRPVIALLTGDPAWNLKKVSAVLQNDSAKRGKVRRCVRGYIEDGRVWATPGNHSSGAISSLAKSNCIIELIPGRDTGEKGSSVWVYLLQPTDSPMPM